MSGNLKLFKVLLEVSTIPIFEYHNLENASDNLGSSPSISTFCREIIRKE